MSNQWFDVSLTGLRQLQEGKPKHFIFRELIQNAWDEDVTECKVTSEWNEGKAKISVEDDSPEGFRDLRDSFTLFAPTYKRAEAAKRGRFNFGEKQVLCLCDEAVITSTKGTVRFDKEGRHTGTKKREKGTDVSVVVRMTKKDYDDCMDKVRTYLVPKNIRTVLNGEELKYREPYQTIEPCLKTEIEKEGGLRREYRTCNTDLHRKAGEKARLYEMGLYVCDIDGDFDVDVQQKIPLTMERDTVPAEWTAELYAEILNATYAELEASQASDLWVRTALQSGHVSEKVVKFVMNLRYGDKVVVANPFDKNSIDDAIANGYRVVYGSELSKEEWNAIKDAQAIPSSSLLFAHRGVGGKSVEKTKGMEYAEWLAKKVAKHCLYKEIEVKFSRWEGNVLAQYGEGVLIFNVEATGEKFYEQGLTKDLLSLVIHEVGHERGMHTEAGYHDALTEIGARLVLACMQNPKFLEKETKNEEV